MKPKGGLHDSQTLDRPYSPGLCDLYQYEKVPSKIPLAVGAPEECYSLRKEIVGSDHLHVQIAAYGVALAYQEDNQLTSAADLLQASIKRILAAHSTAPEAVVRCMLTLQGEVYWKWRSTARQRNPPSFWGYFILERQRSIQGCFPCPRWRQPSKPSHIPGGARHNMTRRNDGPVRALLDA